MDYILHIINILGIVIFASWNVASQPTDCLVTVHNAVYVGHTAETIDGTPCIRWDRRAKYNRDRFSDNRKDHNYCRDPSNDNREWCYTTVGGLWGWCNVPVCDCRTTDRGTEYVGTVSNTDDGTDCKRWGDTSDTPVDGKNHNNCRNPDNWWKGIWCYKDDGSGSYETCTLPMCGPIFCPEQCETCTLVPMECQECKPGFHGNKCAEQCPVNCPGNTCNQDGSCCTNNKYGASCDTPCPDNCANGCYQWTGECPECKPGFHGNKCSEHCSDNCALIDGGRKCNKDSAYCDGCIENHWDNICDETCNSNCPGNTCNRNNGSCIGCTNNNYGALCDIPCPENCANGCYQWTGDCPECKPGFHGNKCTEHCPDNCALIGGGRKCNKETAYCEGCIDNHWGETCEESCNENCLGITCNRGNGHCNDCKPGYLGATCNESCANCADGCTQWTTECNTCNDYYWGDICKDRCSMNCLGTTCIKENGTCNGCANNTFGAMCDTTCPVNCENRCEQWTGFCITCRDSYWGDTCRFNCSKNCTGTVCIQSNGTCYGCEGNTYGATCNMACPMNCKDGCNQMTGHCNSCIDGKWGEECYNSCGKCENSICFQSSGECESCQAGHWGNHCNETCGECEGVMCDQSTAVCPGECHAGYHEPRCDHNCPQNCTDQICTKAEGECVSCINGFHGLFCERLCSNNCSGNSCLQEKGKCHSCEMGRRGDYCAEPCPANCGGTKECDQTNSKCRSCEKDKYYGDACDNECSTACSESKCERESGSCLKCNDGLYGEKCNHFCPENCNGTQCIKQSGKCEECSKGYYGQTCNQTCPDNCLNNICDMEKGHCIECPPDSKGNQCAETQKLTDDPVPAIAGGVSGFLCAAIIFMILIVLVWIRRGKPKPWKEKKPKSSNSFQGVSYPAMANPGLDSILKVDDADEALYENLGPAPKIRTPLSDDILKLRSKKNGFVDEFKNISTEPHSSTDYGRNSEIIHRNRFRNIIPYDNNRVKLCNQSGKPLQDYVNASYINGYMEPKAFIAAQGPNSKTVDHFIQLLWEEKVPVIVMVTKLREDNKDKCARYWPDVHQSFQVGLTTILTQSEDERHHFITRNFLLRQGTEERTVHHLQFTSWPDHGVPASPSAFLEFHGMARKLFKPSTGPALIHCSAGVGRTGMFIAVDYMLQLGPDEKDPSIPNLVDELREQRINMIQSVDQYIFLYEALAEVWECGKTEFPVNEFNLNDPALTQAKMTNHFQVLEKMRMKMREEELAAAKNPENQDKNRNMKILPDSKYRPYLVTQIPGRNNYINAVFTKGYQFKEELIVTQTPLPDTMVDFWALVHDYDCSMIVSLDTTSSSGYWKQGCAPFSVSCESEDKNNYYSLRKFSYQYQKKHGSVQQYQINAETWPAADILPSSSAMLALAEKVLSARTGSKLLVTCPDGCTRSGLFCALRYVCDKINEEQSVDIFHAVKQIRLSRPQYIPKQVQYQWLHQTTRNYIDSIEVYANFT